MKTVIVKIALIFLSVTILLMMAVNTYMFIVASKLASSNIFEMGRILGKYKVLSNLGLCAFATLLTIILLGIFMGFIVKAFVSSKTVYTLEEVKV